MTQKTTCLPPLATATGGEELTHPAVNPETSEVLAVFPSKSKPGHSHAVARSHSTGDTWCTCPAWKFQRIPPADRVCKHIKRVAAASLAGRGPMRRSEAGSELGSAAKRERARRAAHEAHKRAKARAAALQSVNSVR